MKLLALFLVSMVLMAPVAQAQFDWCNMCIQFAVAEINNLVRFFLSQPASPIKNSGLTASNQKAQCYPQRWYCWWLLKPLQLR